MEKLCRIRELQRAVNRFEAALERSHGICLNEGMALCSLSKAGRLSCGELGEMLGLTPSNTSKVLRSVEGKGLRDPMVHPYRYPFWSNSKSLLQWRYMTEPL